MDQSISLVGISDQTVLQTVTAELLLSLLLLFVLLLWLKTVEPKDVASNTI